jgi:hypothetical protein
MKSQKCRRNRNESAHMADSSMLAKIALLLPFAPTEHERKTAGNVKAVRSVCMKE